MGAWLVYNTDPILLVLGRIQVRIKRTVKIGDEYTDGGGGEKRKIYSVTKGICRVLKRWEIETRDTLGNA